MYVLYMYYICIIYVLYMYYICIIYVLYMYYYCICVVDMSKCLQLWGTHEKNIQ